MIVVVDYGMGNLGSVLNMISKVGGHSIASNDPEEILKAEKLILPGVGSFDQGMSRLDRLGLIGPLEEAVKNRGIPILGFCLGMQLLCEGSDEGSLGGLGWVQGRCKRFEFQANELRVPHMGWNLLERAKLHDLYTEWTPDSRFYFTHSYHLVGTNQSDILAYTTYGMRFVSAVAKENILGLQFHPEKSLRWGMQMLRNYVHLR